MASINKIVPCLWFDGRGEEAAQYYAGIFPNSRITGLSYYGDAGFEHHRQPAGSVMVVSFELDGQPFTALNGGPDFKFNEAISFQVMCDTQEEIDLYWEKLSAGGPPECQVCGWLKDKFGVSWQIVPKIVPEMMAGPATEKSQRVMSAIMQMKKIDVATLQRAYEG